MPTAKKPVKRMSAKQMKKTKGGLAGIPINANLEASANRPSVPKVPGKRVMMD